MSDEIAQPSASELVTIACAVRVSLHCGQCDWNEETGEILMRFVKWCDQEIRRVEYG